MFEYFTFSLIKFDFENDVYTIGKFENIEFCNIKRFIKYFELYNKDTR